MTAVASRVLPALAAAVAGALLLGATSPKPAKPPRQVSVPHAHANAAAPGGTVEYTAEQAWEGRFAFTQNCAECHAGDLQGNNAPALAGDRRSNVGWMTPKTFWQYMTGQMPVGNAGGLSQDDYVKITAFIMQQNGRPAGTHRLDVPGIVRDTLHMDGRTK